MVTVHAGGGLGYASTADLSEGGLRAALLRAKDWALASAAASVVDTRTLEMPAPKGQRTANAQVPWDQVPLRERVDRMIAESRTLAIDPRIVEWEVSVMHVRSLHRYLTSHGGDATQEFTLISPDIEVVANAGAVTQRRGYGLRGASHQGGMEVLARMGFFGSGRRVAEEALQLLLAPECPTDRRDLLLMPDQMMLQIHESIGHPLELDRILGDERNYAGTSFVTPDMFGRYAYGSPLLNVTFDPTVVGEYAGYDFDDDGSPAQREHLIRDGLLVRPLGGYLSQVRAAHAGFALGGVANARASSWNRPPIDRMANLNIEPGTSSLQGLIGQVERGVLMKTNTSWSIDDSRNKFQFGCEWGQLIEGGQLTTVVRNPNYRGVSSSFWRSLKGVGDRSTFEVWGTPYCGKGEPNQVIRVGHASPACLFEDVEVFGGEA